MSYCRVIEPQLTLDSEAGTAKAPEMSTIYANNVPAWLLTDRWRQTP
jgi:hypothetical protein